MATAQCPSPSQVSYRHAFQGVGVSGPAVTPLKYSALIPLPPSTLRAQNPHLVCNQNVPFLGSPVPSATTWAPPTAAASVEFKQPLTSARVTV